MTDLFTGLSAISVEIKIPKISENYKFKTWNIKQKIINAEMRDDIYLTVPSRQKNKIRIEIENFKNPISKNVKALS